MAHFAKIGLNSKVMSVNPVHNNELKDSNGVEQENLGIEFLTNLHKWPIWKQTSYNSNIRKNFAGIGYTYDEDRQLITKVQQQTLVQQDQRLGQQQLRHQLLQQ